MNPSMPRCETLIDGPDGRARLWVDAIAHPAVLMEELEGAVHWQTEFIRMFGKTYKVPRKVAWHGDVGAVYRYAGVDHEPSPWFPVLEGLRERVAELAGAPFNSVLLNRYRDGNDCMGWHRDNERELGDQPVIASVSLGAERRFDLRHVTTKEQVSCLLPVGSVLVMDGPLQSMWQHRLPRAKKVTEPRINLTFRFVLSRRTS
jgi:alkylated DNA repair dioxygenase AlkB